MRTPFSWLGLILIGALALSLPVAADPLPCPYPGTPITYPGICHPYPQPRPDASTQSTSGDTNNLLTTVDTGEGIYPAANPFDYKTFPGTNFLPNVYTNMFDGAGNEMPDTLPSTPTVPYNLHDGDPVVSEINPTSPADDLFRILNAALMQSDNSDRTPGDAHQVVQGLQTGIAIVKGDPVPNRAYSGIPLLHYVGPEKVGKVQPIKDASGKIIGGNVDVHQIWYGQHIESDTAFLDTSLIDEAAVPWTVTYTVDVLNRGHDDFSPFVTYRDPYPPGGGKPVPHIGMDQSFFNMEDGTRTVFKIKMTKPEYLNLVYTWGWRSHPPRIQVMENASKTIGYPNTSAPPACPDYGTGPGQPNGLTLPEVEQRVFCLPEDPHCTKVRCAAGEPRHGERGEPSDCQLAQDYAISQIGEMAPAKRILRALEELLVAVEHDNWEKVKSVVEGKGMPAYLAWSDRTKLPCFAWDENGYCTDGWDPDPESDITIVYVNNTIYGQLTDGGWVRWDDWVERPATLHVTAHNADHYPHSYVIADFGGNRGWENQFKSSTKVAGSGCWFTFGRAHWWLPAGGPNGFLCVAPTEGDTAENAGTHRFEVTFNFDPSRRLRFYQFDPFHHDVSIYSVH